MLLQFEPFTTVITTSFWAALSAKKLDHLGLDDSEMPIYGHFDLGHMVHDAPAPPVLTIDETSFEEPDSNGNEKASLKGRVCLLNTLDEFKKFNRQQWLAYHEFGSIDFFLLAFADLKKYRYYSHVCYPSAFSLGTPISAEQREIPEIVKLGHGKLFDLQDGSTMVVADSSCRQTVVGWHVRAILLNNPGMKKLIALRKDHSHSVAFSISHGPDLTTEDLQRTGWERNSSGKVGPRMVDLASSMDPLKLAEEASSLNLKLIKWRLLPDLDLSHMASAKCLLIGAGTLGCNVTRNLMAWGVKNITLVDNGRISFSNPVRQSLFQYEDCLDGGKPKAPRAAQRAREICPWANVNGLEIDIPMPGHIIEDKEEFESTCNQLDELVKDHDVIFLLTDSRESRWLPALLGSAHSKLVLTVALGFDSFVAMRHGLPGQKIGCYFCHDVNTPSDTLSGRTLDQQCTVTRPGVSGMAASTAVELLASVLQHPLGSKAPATKSVSPTERLPEGSSMLGLVPHQIRGFISHHQNLLLTGEQFSCCPACSQHVIDEYKQNGVEFLRRAISEPGYLDAVTGLANLKEAEQAHIEAYLEDLDIEEDDF